MSRKLAIVLAAGKGTRMKSELPKVLIPVAGRPMIDYVLDVLDRAGISETIVVVGYRADLVRAHLADRPRVSFVEQTEQLGTGHAVMVCRERLAEHSGVVLVVTGDSPLLQQASVETLLHQYELRQSACLLGTIRKENPTGLGRIVRDAQGRFARIVEEKDATPEQRTITEVNMSTYAFECRELLRVLAEIKPTNAQGEYYLTDCPALLAQGGKAVEALPILKPIEALSINTVDELAAVEAALHGVR